MREEKLESFNPGKTTLRKTFLLKFPIVTNENSQSNSQKITFLYYLGKKFVFKVSPNALFVLHIRNISSML